MATKRIIWVTPDGTEFEDERDAIDHELSMSDPELGNYLRHLEATESKGPRQLVYIRKVIAEFGQWKSEQAPVERA